MRPSSAPPATSTVHRTRLFFHCTATTLATAIVLLSPYLPITNARTLHHHRHHRVHHRHHHMSNHSHTSQSPAALPPDASISPTEPPSAFPAEVDNSPSQLPHHDRPCTPSFSPAKPPSLSNAKPPSIHLAKQPMPSPAKPPSLSQANAPSISPARPPSHFPDKAPSSSPHSMPPSFSPSKPPALSLADPPSSRPKKLPLSPVNPQPHHPAEPPSLYPVAGPPLLPPVMAKATPPSIAPAVTKAKPPSLAPAIAKARPPSLAPVMAKAKPPSLAPAIAKAKPPSLAPAIVKAMPPSLSPTSAKARAPTLAPEMPKARPPSLAPAMAKPKPPHFYPANPPAFSPAGPAKDNSTTAVYDVRAFGAVGNGSSDDTRAFRAAWKAACAAESAVLLVPSDGVFMVTSTIFSGPCLSGMTFQIDGVLMPPDGPKSWPATDSRRQWIVFYRADGMALRGRGTIEGNGEEWWNLPCKPHRGPNGSTLPGPCDSPALIRFFLSNNVTVKDLRIENSPQFHVKFDGCEGVRVDDLFISSPAFSPNTDGVHIENTKSVQIYNSKISNGDDCISIGTGCSHVHIENVTCGHGHGISIGSLGVHNSRACVSNITVRNTRIRDSDNGVRIKTWQGGTGSVSGVEFDGVQMENVKNCIIIDQYYCLEKGCANQTSAVYVTGVAYRGIRGTYNPDGGAPIRLACSDAVACTDITMAVVELLPHGGGPATVLAEPYCWNAYGVMETLTLPPVYCLQEGKPQSLQDQLTSSC